MMLSTVGMEKLSAVVSLPVLWYLCYIQQYSGVNIGPVHKKDIMKCSTMLEHDGQ